MHMIWTCLSVAAVACAGSQGLLEEIQESECKDSGVQLLQSSAKRPKQTRSQAKTSLPFASLAEGPPPLMMNHIKQAVALAQTRVQTKVGEAPYFIIAVAIGGFALSLLSICVSLMFVQRGLPKGGDGEEPTTSALLARQLRAFGVGDARRRGLWSSELQPARTWEHSQGHAGSQRAMADGQNRVQIVVREPLEGGRIGLNLSEDDLVVNNFGDLRASDYGFRIGDRIVQVNQALVFKEVDFRFVMEDALRRHSAYGEPIIFQVLRRPLPPSMSAPLPLPYPSAFMPSPAVPMASQPASASLQAMPEVDGHEDLKGSWCYGDSHTDDLYTYLIRQAGNELGFEQTLPNGEKITGILVQEELWLRSALQSKHGFYGELRLQYDPEDEVMVSQFKKKDDTKWSGDILARRVKS